LNDDATQNDDDETKEDHETSDADEEKRDGVVAMGDDICADFSSNAELEVVVVNSIMVLDLNSSTRTVLFHSEALAVAIVRRAELEIVVDVGFKTLCVV
jgi:hypothetical protein